MDLEAMAVTVIHFNCLHSHVKSPKFFWGVVKVKGPLGPYGRMISNDQGNHPNVAEKIFRKYPTWVDQAWQAGKSLIVCM